ncbi:MAG: PD-(D/E)XK nuclease family protein [Acidimicrobiia bacterium]|nr:PD-(D/E)XK nuclease family protein [Acidimicrobiia bacterium]
MSARQPIPRDRFGSPYVVPPNGGKPVPYTRATTWAGTLDDRWNLEQWKMRQVAIGLADRPDLLLAVTTQRDDKKALNAAVQAAMEAAKSSAAATRGTALHTLTELLDLGRPLPTIPLDVVADLAAYETATAGLEMISVEEFVVVDELQVAGTFDRLVRHEGKVKIADLKTGASVEYAMGSIALQLAIYSRGVAYDHTTGTRTPLPDVDQEEALVIHLPAGLGVCTLLRVNIRLGWEAVLIAGRVRRFRKYAASGKLSDRV